MRCLINGVWQTTIDAQNLHYTHTTADPISTCQVNLVDNTSAITVQKLQEVVILDEKVIPNPTLNLLPNPTFNPYTSNWTAPSYSGLTYTQINQSVANYTFYLSSIGSAVYPSGNVDQLFVIGGTPSVTSFANVIGNNVTGWGEIVNRSGSVWAASGVIGQPTGRGWLYDSAILQGQTVQAGAYSPTFRLNATQLGVGAGTLIGDLVCRLWKWNSSTLLFTPVMTSTLAGQTVSGTATAYSFPPGYGAATAFGVGDYVYVDLWFDCKTNTNGSVNQAITINNLSTDSGGKTGDVNAQIVTPGVLVSAAISLNINSVATGINPAFEQFIAAPVVPGQSYMLSGYFQFGATDPNVGGFLQINWFDASQTFISNAFYFGPKPGSTALTRYQIQGSAPGNAVYANAWFGFQTTSNTNSATLTLSNVQFEPMWFSDYTYPLPFCGPNQPNCAMFAGSLMWYRQYRKFAGLVDHVLYQGYIGNKRTVQVNAVGFAWLMGLVYANDTFSAAFDSAIITSLLSTYYGNLFDTSGVVQGVQISNLFCNWDDLRTVFDGLAAQAGAFWTMNEYWQMLYQPPGYATMPYGLLCDDSGTPDMETTFPAFNFSAEMDYTQPGSNVLVIGGTPANTTLTAALSSGTHYTSLSVVALPQPWPAGMPCSVAGQQGIVLSADAAQGATSLTIFSFLALNTYAIGTTITPDPYVARVLDPAATNAMKQNVLYGNGAVNSLLMRKINDSTLQSMSDTAQRGLAELLQFDPERYIYHLTTNVELLAGQGIPVTSNTDNLNATTLLIQTVTATWMGTDETLTDTWEYSADLGSINRAASNIMSHLFRRTNTNTSSPQIIQTALVALEHIGIVDGPPVSTSYQATVLADIPFAYWRLNELSGTVAYDSSGAPIPFNGTLVGVTAYGQPGALVDNADTSIAFSASGGLVAPADLHDWQFFAATLEFWVYITGWTYVAVTTDGSTTTMYLQGSPYTSGGSGDAVTLGALFDVVGAIGAGRMAQVALYNYALSAAQVQNHYFAGLAI